MDRVSFSTWMNEGGSVFAGDDVAAQTASSTVNTKAASGTNIKTTTPQVHNNDIGIYDTGIPSVTRWDAIEKPTIHNPFTHEVEGEVKIADENIDIFTPSVKLTDVFSTNMDPFLGESSSTPQHSLFVSHVGRHYNSDHIQYSALRGKDSKSTEFTFGRRLKVVLPDNMTSSHDAVVTDNGKPISIAGNTPGAFGIAVAKYVNDNKIGW